MKVHTHNFLREAYLHIYTYRFLRSFSHKTYGNAYLAMSQWWH
jgi:hypothetical protein